MNYIKMSKKELITLLEQNIRANEAYKEILNRIISNLLLEDIDNAVKEHMKEYYCLEIATHVYEVLITLFPNKKDKLSEYFENIDEYIYDFLSIVERYAEYLLYSYADFRAGTGVYTKNIDELKKWYYYDYAHILDTILKDR